MTRGRCGSLLLHRVTLPFTTPRRFNPAHGGPAMTEQAAPALTQSEIDERVFDLYDEYCHGRIERREFLQRAGALTIGGVSALAMAQACCPAMRWPRRSPSPISGSRP